MDSEISVNIKSLRKFANDKLPWNSILRELLLSESDLMDAEEFLVKMEVWLRLLRIESNKDHYRE